MAKRIKDDVVFNCRSTGTNEYIGLDMCRDIYFTAPDSGEVIKPLSPNRTIKVSHLVAVFALLDGRDLKYDVNFAESRDITAIWNDYNAK